MDPSSRAARQSPYAVTRPESKGQPDGSQPATPQRAQVLPGPSAGQAMRQGLVQPADLPASPRSSLPSMSPQLPGQGIEPAQTKGAKDTKHQPPDAKQLPAAADSKRFAGLVTGVEALARKVTSLVPSAGTPAGEVTAQAGKDLAKAVNDGLKALLRDVRLETDAAAQALLGTLVPAVEANFDMRELPGSVRPGAGLGTSLRSAVIGLLLSQVQDLRPLAHDRVADAILPHADQPLAWVRGLMLQPELGAARPPYEAMLDRIVRIAGERSAGDAGEAWRVEAVRGLAQAQQRQMEMADDMAKLSELGLDPRLLASSLVGLPIPGPQPVQIRTLQALTLLNGVTLRQLACGRARELGPQALSVLVGELTAQIERTAPTGGATLATQVVSLVWQVLVSTGVDHPPVVALVQALDRAMVAARTSDEQAPARACIRGGLLVALGRYYAELKTGLLPLAGGDKAQEAEISRMLGASEAALLKAVSTQARDVS